MPQRRPLSLCGGYALMLMWGIIAVYVVGCAVSAFLIGYFDAKCGRDDPPAFNIFLAIIWPAFWFVVALAALLLGAARWGRH